MQRLIVCSSCEAKVRGLDLDDLIRGLLARHSTIFIKRAENQGEILCDKCARLIPDNQAALAITIWNTRREPEPKMWESLYGTVALTVIIGTLPKETTDNNSQNKEHGKPN